MPLSCVIMMENLLFPGKEGVENAKETLYNRRGMPIGSPWASFAFAIMPAIKMH